MAEGKEKKGFFKRLVSGLTKTRDNIVSGFDSIFSGFSHIDDDFYEELEEILVMGDIGIRATEEIIENLKQKVKENHIKEPADCRELLINSIKEQMYVGDTAYRFEEEKSVVLVIGVNGVGKTTTIGKLAGKLKNQGKKVILWTCRCGDLLEEAVAWCRMFGLEFDAVNENVAQTLEQYGTESRKISADVYIDDKACWPWMTKQEWEQYLAG